LLNACSGTKFLKEDQVLYKGYKIEYAAPDSILNKKLLKNEINKKLVPKPNKKLLGLFATRVWLYTKVEPKKEKGFKFWLKNKIGKEPVLIENIELEQKELILEKTMQDNGYFYSDVESEVVEKKKLGTVHYKINNGAPSYIKEFNLPTIQPDLDTLFRQYDKYKVKAGEMYNLLNIQADRNGLSDYIRSEGYFDFDRSDIVYFVDTSKIQQKKRFLQPTHKEAGMRNPLIFHFVSLFSLKRAKQKIMPSKYRLRLIDSGHESGNLPLLFSPFTFLSYA